MKKNKFSFLLISNLHSRRINYRYSMNGWQEAITEVKFNRQAARYVIIYLIIIIIFPHICISHYKTYLLI